MSAQSIDMKKELARFLLEQVKERRLEKDLAVGFLKTLADQPAAGAEDMAIIGMACRFPGADNKEEFWANLLAGRSAIGPFPPHRRADLGGIDDGRIKLFEGGFLDSVDGFDHDYFRIPPNVARHMDPYQRLFMETAVEAIEDAGYTKQALHGKPVGVFVGNDHTHRLINSYLDFIAEPDFNSLTGSWTGVLASRISYLFNLKGPAVVVDTACSSGLVALDQAIKALRDKDCEVALVGAANLFFLPSKGIVGEIESESPQVRAFDRDAHGTVWGEGVAALLVKPLAQALRDGDAVYAVVKGIAINNDGASNGLTAPNAKAQQEVILKAWERAGINPEELSYIETHGTGTHLGDPIEIKGLAGAFSRHSARRQFCGIGSVKTNIGHTVGTAGLASLIKVLLSLKHGQIPPSIHFDAPNPFIDFCDSPVYLNDRVRDWQPGEKPRLAGVSSFSLCGTNCHVVVQEAPARPDAQAREGHYLFPVSARNPGLLALTLRRYLAFLDGGQTPTLAEICHTAATGREHHKLRAAVLAQDLAGLRASLLTLLEAVEEGRGCEDGRVFYPGAETRPPVSDREAKARAAEAAQKPDAKSLAALAEAYLGGAAIPWDELWKDSKPQRVGLPPQPFQHTRFWEKPPAATFAAVSTATPQPETSDLEDKLPGWAEFLAKVQAEPVRVAGLESIEDSLPYAIAAYLWSEVLGYPRLELDEDYYALGGDSITGMKIVHLFNTLFGMNLSPADILAAPTLRQFVGVLLDKHGFSRILSAPEAGEAELIERLPPAPAYALSRAEKRMFLLDRMNPGSTSYNVNAVVAMAATDPREAEAIIRRIIDRHEILRAGFELREGEPVKTIRSSVPFAVETLEIPPTGQPEAALRQAVEAFIRPFDIARPPLLRVAFARSPSDFYMMIDMHHIVTDGSSMGVIIGEYLALEAGQTLEPLPFQYQDFAAWQNRRFESGIYQPQADFWKARFEDGIPALELKTDYPRPGYQDFQGSKEHFFIDAELAAGLRSLARAQGATLFMVLLAAFKTLLYRLGGGDDLVVGSPVAGRSRLDLHGLVGMFVNTLALRDRVLEEDSFATFLNTVKTNTLAALQHQDYPYEELLEILDVPRNAGRNPLFDVYFVLQNEDMGFSGGRKVRTVPYDTGTAKFDMTVIAREAEDGILLDWEYAVALYKASTIRRFGAAFLHVLRTVAANPAMPLWQLSLLGEDERRLILDEYNRNATDYPGARGIPALFEAVAQRQPKAVALSIDETDISYAELNAAANRLAHLLVREGTRPGQAVALLYERSPAMVVAILAVLKAGCAYVPLDTENPPGRNTGILEDSQAVLLLVGSGLPVPEGWEGPTLRPEQMDLKALPADNPGVAVTGDSIAYIMYTSGSTGKPKGALIRHKSIIRVVCDTNYIELGPYDTFMLLSNYAFDGSVIDLYGSLLHGGRLVLVPKEDVLDMDRLAGIIQGQGVTVFFATTSLFNALVDIRLDCLANVRYVLFGGEAASTRHVAQAFRLLGPGRLVNGYGPTETTVFATAHVVDAIDDRLGAVPIGRPLANTRVYVLDNRLLPVPLGVEGELYIGGDGLALGYLNRDELNAERFIADPFLPGERVYRTGDLVKWLEDGSLQFLGRRDHQVKIRGFRIELGEIEASILRHPTVKECLVSADADAAGRKQLCAYVVPEQVGDFSIHELRAFLSASLPDYMVPQAIMALPAFPLTPNGKVDRRKLPTPDLESAEAVAARNPREAALAQIWAEVLDCREVGIHDNFFALGGDSIKAIQLAARLQAQGLAVRVPLLFQYQTIAELAPHLGEAEGEAAEQGEVTGPLRLNPIQRWFLESSLEDPHYFNQSVYVALAELPPAAEVWAAAQALCAHHDALRAVFRRGEDGFEAEIRDSSAKSFCLLEWESYLSDPAEFGEDPPMREFQSSLDLEHGPLMAIGLIRSPAGAGICIAVHHLVVDVVSWNVLLEDFQTCLEAAAAGKPPQLPAKTASLIAWNESLHQHAHAEEVLDSLPYWLALAQKPYATLCEPSLAPGRLAEGRTVRMVMDAKTSGWVAGEANRAFNTEPQHLLLCALGQALSAWKGQGDYLLNLEGHGRDGLAGLPEAGRTVGWFTAAFPFAVSAPEDLGEAVKEAKESLRAVPGKGMAYGLLAYLATDIEEAERDSLRAIRPQIGFNFLGNLDAMAGRDEGVKVLGREVNISPAARLELPLDIVASLRGGRVELEALFDPARLAPAEVGSFLALYQDKLALLAAHCMGQESSEKTASDFTTTKLSQDELSDIFDDLELT